MGRKTLILGANSRVGRMLRRQWADVPEMAWLARSGTSPLWSLQDGVDALGPILRDADVVLCLAGATAGAGVPLALNVEIACAVLQAASAGSHVFLASSMAVYGSGARPHREGAAAVPSADYGRSKLEMEQAARAIADRRGVGLTSLRLANIVGADMLFANIAAGRAITLDRFADGATPARSYLDPVSLGDALVRLFRMARAGAALPEVLNLATEPPVEMAALLGAAGLAYETRAAPDKAQRAVTMDISQASALIPELAEPRDAAAMIAAWRRVEAMA